MSKKIFEHLEPNEVLFVEEEIKKNNAFIPNTTFQAVELVQFLLKKLGADEKVIEAWTLQGIDCKALKLDGGGWIKGKFKLTLELYPDEKSNPDSLDDLRKELNQ